QANCRQLFHRAKERIQERRPRFRDEAREKRALVDRFATALRDGDADGLASVLAEDAGFWSDGGGKGAAARRPLVGREPIVTMLVGIRRTAETVGIPLEQVRLEVMDVNGEPALVMLVAGVVNSIYTFSTENGVITALRIVRNPEKLRYIAGQLR